MQRFSNALIRHPVLSREQLVVQFLTVPTVRGMSILGYSSLIVFPGIGCLGQAGYSQSDR